MLAADSNSVRLTASGMTRTVPVSFQRQNPCPSTSKTSVACPGYGYVVDHVTPLKRGGTDYPSNMQWQTNEVAKDKDKSE